MIKKITIPFFPKGLQYATPLFFGAATYLIFIGQNIWGEVLLLICILILTTRYVTEINLQEKKYNDYLSLLGIHLNNESHPFKQLDRIVITKGSYSQRVVSRTQDRNLDWTDYTATLIFDRDQTLNLLTLNDKEKLLKGLKDFSTFLDVDVQDRSTRDHYWVDMTKI